MPKLNRFHDHMLGRVVFRNKKAYTKKESDINVGRYFQILVHIKMVHCMKDSI